MTDPLFPAGNPEVTDGPGRLPRRTEAFLQLLIDEFFAERATGAAELGHLTHVERMHLNRRKMDLFSQAFLLAAIHENAADANTVAALADQLDSGEIAEWMNYWRAELQAGDHLSLPMPVTRIGVDNAGVVDGDVLAGIAADLMPREFSPEACQEYAETLLAKMHEGGFTILRGPASRPWTPPRPSVTDTAGTPAHQ